MRSPETANKALKWGMASIVALLAAMIALAVSELLKNGVYGEVAVLFESLAVASGFVAAVRGNKWWFMVSGLAALFLIQTVAALIVGDL